MRPLRALRTLWRLAPADRVAVTEALVTLAIASASIRLLPFRSVVRVLASSRPRRASTNAFDERETRRVRWAIEAWSRRVPWRTVCFQKGLAMHMMLQRRGIASTLHYGVRTDQEKGLAAHVWVTENGQAVIGGEEAAGFTCLAIYPEHAR